MSRHTRLRCKIANSDEGLEKLMEHTLQRQMADQQRQIAEQSAKIDRLATLLEQQMVPAAGDAPPLQIMHNNAPVAMHNAPVTNITNTVHNNITIRPWGQGPRDHIIIPASMLRAAFTENPRLAEYCSLTDEEKVDAERAVPYVAEALVELVKRAHADPQARNIYLNPRRADQVLVFDEATWKALSLVEAIKALFDSVAGNIQRIIITNRERAELPFEVQASASWMPNLYGCSPDAYVAKARPQVAAHLTNMALAQAPPALAQ